MVTRVLGGTLHEDQEESYKGKETRDTEANASEVQGRSCTHR
jgi:hypothetical protein